MEFPSPLTQAVFLNRHKRFLAEVIVNNQEHRIIYCPNMGQMTGCDILGSRIWFSTTLNHRRKFPDTWELVEVDVGHLVCVNVKYAPLLILEGIKNNRINLLEDCQQILLSPPLLGDHHFDLLLNAETQKCFVQIQNVTLGDEIHRGFYPDSATSYACEQLNSLMHAAQLGYKAVLIYCVMHTGINRVFPADHINSDYGCLLRQAVIAGVKVIGYRVEITLNNIEIKSPVEVCIPARLIGSGLRQK